MPKQLINTVGLLVVLGIIAAATLFVALPIYIQSLGTDGQTSAVANQNAGTQAQVDALTAKDVSSVEADAAELRAQIPDAAHIDTVSSLIAAAASAHKVTVVSITPAAPEAFVAPGAQPAATGTETTQPSDGSAASGEAGEAALTGKLQVPIEFEVTGSDLSSIVGFLDALRAGPRLLGDIQVTYSDRSGDANARVKALAFSATAGS